MLERGALSTDFRQFGVPVLRRLVNETYELAGGNAKELSKKSLSTPFGAAFRSSGFFGEGGRRR